jgi:hypothetical protein
VSGTAQARIEACSQAALALLRRNLSPHGILAATRTEAAEARRYTRIFGRDAAICVLAMCGSGDALLEEAAVASLDALAREQARNGQIPKYVDPDGRDADFWYLGCIDATLWWLIAVDHVRRHGSMGSAYRQSETGLAIQWLQAQEHPHFRLLQQNEASDWADIMPRSGFVLYTNALWYWTKRLYGLPTVRHTRDYANLFFAPFGNVAPEHRRARLLMHYIRNRSKPTPFYLSFVNFSHWGEENDIFGNILAHLVGVGDASGAGKVASALTAMKANHPYPIRVVGTPIRQQSALWRLYMQRHRQNLPWQYHNGGIWPFVGGFWVMLLARLGKEKDAWVELEKLALVNRVNDWEFNEWFQGQTGEPMGMPRQSWNAALFIMAYRTLVDKSRFFK